MPNFLLATNRAGLALNIRTDRLLGNRVITSPNLQQLPLGNELDTTGDEFNGEAFNTDNC
ncbi:hypothetical protein KR51_00035670 [Rubidibacter lacunae KORDI 51-2]|uniref:Uncharacterized protein n=1 Tax=Rubidibacter lacunae KORDI 51-2 TaxID=582515 RepID=U5DF90_9CHRO|nr:hypothetical protein [Rubidibacter lacunae]ERN39967.1 hypothetical protein KR51_00035670 [Rubidibacter lacunae KORDI 51-2]